ncbi:transcriptional regulator [Rhizobium sp. HT1-10]|uniref:transcriptional regulator n=1 Tax=Rhizobium sp. HT1-10 TaxID=3111638 RepID=UPI003C1BD0AD
MKKVQRSFVVEYKSGRQKLDPKSNSIWGKIDLKSVAREVKDDAVSFLSGGPADGSSDSALPVSKTERAGPLWTPPTGQHTTPTVTEETATTAEIDTITKTEAPAVTAPPIAPKKPRQPRATNASPQTASVDDAMEPADASARAPAKQKRERKAKPIEGNSADRRAPKDVPEAPAVPMAAVLPTTAVETGDKMADLLQLEEENQKLRMLLAEKLRAENADLRKRLKLD